MRAIERADSGQGCHGEGSVAGMVGLMLLFDPLMVTCNFGYIIFEVAAKMDYFLMSDYNAQWIERAIKLPQLLMHIYSKAAALLINWQALR